MNIEISIIIPAFNEEGAIAETLKKIAALPLPSFEIVVVNDGSSDETGPVLDRLLPQISQLRVLHHPYNMGNGASVKTGMRAARGQALVFLDGDGQHNPTDIPRLIAALSDYHMVVGARSKGSNQSLHRGFANAFYNRFASFVAEFEIQDLTSGFRAMRRADALRFCDMLPNRFSYPTTSTLAFIRSGRSLTYLPIIAAKRVGTSKINIVRDGFEFFMIIIKIAMTFSPLRVFLPISSFLFFLGLIRYLQTFLLYGRFTNMAHLLITTSVVIFMLGLVAEQIALLRLERGDSLHQPEDNEYFKRFKAL